MGTLGTGRLMKLIRATIATHSLENYTLTSYPL